MSFDLFFRLFAYRDVHYRDHKQRLIRRLKRSESDFGWKFRAILAKTIKITSHSHQPGMWICHEICKMNPVAAAKAIRNQLFDVHPDHFCTVIPKIVFRLCIDHSQPVIPAY